MTMKTNYSLLVVDDEARARRHIVEDIEWDSIYVTEIYEASNGVDALKVIDEKKPDIIIMDLKMPVMDGVSLLENIINEEIDIQVIALSGYSDFNAARKMLNSGIVVEYLLKPATQDALLEAADKCISNIEEKRRVQQLKNNFDKARNSIRKTALGYCLFGNQEEDDVADYINNDNYVQVAVTSANNSDANGKNYTSTVEDDVSVFIYQCPSTNRKAIVFSSDKIEKLKIASEKICRKISEKTDGYIGLGRIYQSEYNLNISYQEALLSYVSKEYMEGSRLRHIDNVEYEISNQKSSEVNKDTIINQLRNGDLDGIDQSVRVLLKEFIHNNRERLFMNNKDKLNINMISIYFAAIVDSVLEERKEEFNILSILAARDIEDLLKIIHNTFEQYYNSFSKSCAGHKKKMIEEVKKYIDENYSEHITLDTLSQILYINPSYLSRLFSEIEKCGFSEYLSKVRIEKAKQYLTSRKYKVNEISEKVGYRSVKHFLRMFRKFEGMTPSEYRERNLSL